MKKILALGLCLVTAVSLMTGCNSEKSTETESDATELTEKENQESVAQTTEPEESELTESESEAITTKPEESSPEESESSESESEAQTTEPEKSESSESESEDTTSANPVEGLSEKYVDLDNRSFAVNGKVYTLGVNTLQDMIDDGVPFNENDIANANNNLNPNYESSGFKIVLGDYYSAQVSVANFTEENASAASCVLSQVYLPVHQDEEQNILQFSFPLTLSEEKLIEQAGEPTDRRDYKSDDSSYESHTLEYKVESENYIGSSGYTFEFANGELKYITINWKL